MAGIWIVGGTLFVLFLMYCAMKIYIAGAPLRMAKWIVEVQEHEQLRELFGCDVEVKR